MKAVSTSLVDDNALAILSGGEGETTVAVRKGAVKPKRHAGSNDGGADSDTMSLIGKAEPNAGKQARAGQRGA